MNFATDDEIRTHARAMAEASLDLAESRAILARMPFSEAHDSAAELSRSLSDGLSAYTETISPFAAVIWGDAIKHWLLEAHPEAAFRASNSNHQS